MRLREIEIFTERKWKRRRNKQLKRFRLRIEQNVKQLIYRLGFLEGLALCAVIACRCSQLSMIVRSIEILRYRFKVGNVWVSRKGLIIFLIPINTTTFRFRPRLDWLILSLCELMWA